MNFVRGFFSGILSFVLVIVFIALGIFVTINYTVLDPDFVISKLDKFDVYSIAAEQVKRQLPVEEPYIAEFADEIITELEPWVKEQTANVIYAGYAYLKGEEELNIVIPLEEVKTCLRENFEQAIRESPPPELEGASQSEIEAFISQAYAEIDDRIPQQIEITETYLTSLNPEITAQLQEARQIVSYIELCYKWLIGAVFLLVLLIALIQWWHIKPIARYVGIPAVIAGVISLIGSILPMAAESLVVQTIPPGIPPEVMSILSQLVADFTAPLRIYGIALLIAGIGLVVLSVKLKPSSQALQEESP